MKMYHVNREVARSHSRSAKSKGVPNSAMRVVKAAPSPNGNVWAVEIKR